MEVNKDKYSFEDLEAEQKQIEDCYLTLRFAQKVRRDTLACFKKCGGQIKYPFRIEVNMLLGKEEICFGDCLNLNFEKGPYLRELGKVPEDAVPKKFIWAHSL
jgi:hypothetical protein